MKKWLTSLFLLFALAGGVLAGMPLHSGKTDSRMMPCCKKAKSKEQTPKAGMARLCCALNCTDSAPTTPSGSAFNFSPTVVIVSDSIIKQIASLLLATEKPSSAVSNSPERGDYPRRFQPKYIEHHSFLI